jgi:hypothetical protein
MTSFDVTNGVNRLQSTVNQLLTRTQEQQTWIDQEKRKTTDVSIVLLWNESLQIWLARENLAPTSTSRIFYYYHMWIYQLYLWFFTQQKRNRYRTSRCIFVWWISLFTKCLSWYRNDSERIRKYV